MLAENCTPAEVEMIKSVPISDYGYEPPWTMSINCYSTSNKPSSTAATTIMM